MNKPVLVFTLVVIAIVAIKVGGDMLWINDLIETYGRDWSKWPV